MSDFHFIAVLTYGKEKHGAQSDFKLGQGAGMSVLLALFGTQAREFVVPRASYRYVNLEVKGVSAYRNYLVLNVTPDEKAQVETICRKQGSYTWVYLWEQDTRRWLEFPSAPQAHYIDPSSYGGSCPRFPPTHAKFVTPSKLTDDAPEAKAADGLTLTQSGDWWWIAGDTYAHREVLRTAGANWSKSRHEWYFKGQALPQAIRDLAALQAVPPPALVELPTQAAENIVTSSGASFTVVKHDVTLSTFAVSEHEPASVSEPITPAALSTDDPVAARPELLDAAPDVPEALMRSVRTDDVTAALVAHIHDNERSKPVMVDFIGSRNAVKQLLSKPFNPAYLGARAEGSAFMLTDGSRYTSFRLPDTSYKTLNTALGGRVVEGRIVSLEATVSAPRESCYVLVMNRIELPVEVSVDDAWLHYVRYRQTPNRPEFSRYVPPLWAGDLYNVYQALRARIGRPLHERWMPWLFAQVADKSLTSERLGLKDVVLCKYIVGYVDPKVRGVVESGAYRLTCREMGDLWAEVLIRNPNRADGITFSQQP